MNISDIIEGYIVKMMADASDPLNISRNDLAAYFACAPSQINYVLSTRFTVDKGYVVESKRGGGGYITVYRINPKERLNEKLLNDSLKEVSYNKGCNIIDGLVLDGVLTEREGNLVKACIDDKALVCPIKINKDEMRGSILKNFLLNLVKENSL